MADTRMLGFVLEKSVGTLKSISMPMPAENEVLIKIKRSGICATDLELIKGYMGFEGVIGHEFVGVVESSGGVAGKELVGKRVCGEINLCCRKCPVCEQTLCARGRNHCPHRSVLGILGKHGTYAEYITLPAANCHVVPDSLPDRSAAFVEPVAAAFRPFEQGSVKPKQRVCVIGDGRLGLLCAVVAAYKQCEVTMIGKHEDKMHLLPPAVRRVRLTEDTGKQLAGSFEVVIECSGHSSGFSLANDIVQTMGTIVLKTTVHDVSTRTVGNMVVVNEVSVVGSRCGPFPEAIEFLESGFFDATTLLQGEFPLKSVEQALKRAAEPGVLKIHLTME